jgi:hypothetical protein
MGIATYLLSLLTMIMMKNFGIIFNLGLWVVKPTCLFSFLLLIKTMWQIPSIKQENNQQEVKKTTKKPKRVSSKK